MSDLHHKLDEAITSSLSIWKAKPQETTKDAPNGLQWFRPNGGELWFFAFDKEAVKQAFIDAGWHKLKTGDRLYKNIVASDDPVMTGQEWYDRFEKELQDSGMIDTEDGDNVEIAERVASVYSRAARKASGLE